MDGKIVSMIRGTPRVASPQARRHDDRSRREVRAYWEALRQDGALPLRDAIDPRGIAGALEQVFMIERVAPGLARFRLVGSQVTELVGCEVRGMPFSALFDPVARDRVGPLLDGLFDSPALLHLELEAERGIGRPALGAALLLLPLVSRGGIVDLALACLTRTGTLGRAPRRFAISQARTETIILSQPAPTAVAPTPPLPASISPDMPRPPRTEGHLRLVHSAT